MNSYKWNSTSGGDWSAKTDWTPSGVPGSTDSATTGGNLSVARGDTLTLTRAVSLGEDNGGKGPVLEGPGALPTCGTVSLITQSPAAYGNNPKQRGINKLSRIHATKNDHQNSMIPLSRVARRLAIATTSCVAIAVGGAAAAAADNTPPHLALAHDRGVANPDQVITISVHLNRSQPELFEKTLADLYDRGSPRYHQWLTDADLMRFSPPAAQLAAVRDELKRNGLTILSESKYGFSIRARGTLGNIARAFNTEIHEFDFGGRVFRANVRDARLSGAVANYVHAVVGVESHTVRPMLSRAVNLATGKLRWTPFVGQESGRLKRESRRFPSPPPIHESNYIQVFLAF